MYVCNKVKLILYQKNINDFFSYMPMTFYGYCICIVCITHLYKYIFVKCIKHFILYFCMYVCDILIKLFNHSHHHTFLYTRTQTVDLL